MSLPLRQGSRQNAIQIQHLLKLNINCHRIQTQEHSIQIQHLLKLNRLLIYYLSLSANSNTTLVKVKLSLPLCKTKTFVYSNTTLVKVKYHIINKGANYDKFKYNTC